MIRLAASDPDWVLGFEDEVWWSRLAQPALHTWAAPDQPVRLGFDGAVDNLLHTRSRSTGVSTSPAFGRRVAGLLAGRGEDVAPRPGRVTTLRSRIN